MTPEELENWEYVKYKMDEEGFHYCFVHYSNFEEIKDEEFHRLRKEFIKYSKELEKYVNNKCKEDINNE